MLRLAEILLEPRPTQRDRGSCQDTAEIAKAETGADRATCTAKGLCFFGEYGGRMAFLLGLSRFAVRYWGSR
jgi:hypothetical protein